MEEKAEAEEGIHHSIGMPQILALLINVIKEEKNDTFDEEEDDFKQKEDKDNKSGTGGKIVVDCGEEKMCLMLPLLRTVGGS